MYYFGTLCALGASYVKSFFEADECYMYSLTFLPIHLSQKTNCMHCTSDRHIPYKSDIRCYVYNFLQSLINDALKELESVTNESD